MFFGPLVIACPTVSLAGIGQLMVPAVLGLFYTELEMLASLFKPVIWRSQTLQQCSVGSGA